MSSPGVPSPDHAAHRGTGGGPDCCAELERAAGLSRRRFLAGMAATSGALVATSMFGDAFRQTAFGATRTAGTGTGNVLVVLSLRGGIDGLGLVVPHADPHYATARPTIKIPTASLVCADPQFGLHPQMAPLTWLWDQGAMAAVHAVGLPVPNRSHFSAMEEIEDADTASTTRRGWVNRMIGLDTTTTHEPQAAVQLGSSIVPTELYGPTPVLAATRLDQLTLVGADPDTDPTWAARRRHSLDQVWAGTASSATPALAAAYRSALTTVDTLAPLARTTYHPTTGVTYPRTWPATDLSDALADTAQLIKADLGTDVVAIDYGSWDMHSDYGTLTGGRMQSMTAGLAGVLDAFMRDLGPDLRNRVTLVTISEFGRRTRENGNRGLDHGWGNMMLLLGAGVKGGRYYGTWPGLGTGPDDDLQVTTDYRTVLAEIITRRFPDRSTTQIFPGFGYTPLGFMS